VSFRNLGLVVACLFIINSVHGSEPNEYFHDALWVAESHGILKIAAAGGDIDLAIDSAEEVRAVAIDPVGALVWVARAEHLTAYAFDGEVQHSIELDSKNASSSSPVLSVDQRDGSVWLARGLTLEIFAFDGSLIASSRLSDEVVAMSLGESAGTRWIASRRQAGLRNEHGDVLDAWAVASGEQIRDIALQLTEGGLWLLSNRNVHLYKPVEQDIAWQREERHLERIRLHNDGSAWFAGKRRMLRLDIQGSVAGGFEYGQPGNLVDFAVDPLDGSLWIASQQYLERYGSDGTLIDEYAFSSSDHEGRLWSLALYVDDIPPSLAIVDPVPGTLTNNSLYPFKVQYEDTGIGVDPETLEFSINDTPAPFDCEQLDETGSRCLPVHALPEGGNHVEATVSDFNMNVSAPASVDLIVDTIPPEFLALSPENGSVVSESPATVSGQLTETAVLEINGNGVAQDAELWFAEDVALSEGSNTVDLIAVDPAGNATHQELSIKLEQATEGLPPDPEDVAPDLEPGVSTPFHEHNEFLYTGSDPIQRDADPDAIEPERAAVLRGKVLNRSGEPLPGVRVRVLNHSEYGYTLSRLDGEFDLAVNGGGSLIVDFQRDGHLPAQRKVRVPWKDYVYVDEVSLVELDQRVTVVDLTDDTAGMQVARGSVETDVDGARQATVLFPAETKAQAVLPTGETVALDQVSFRATEYTVGERGPSMMPGDLPDNVGYTYAVELSIDEALAVGASDVEFDRGVPFYVENFLDFPTGTGVPVAYYDRETGEWIAHDNGAIIEIMDVIDGKAVLDVTGDGQATPELLDLLQITDTEKTRLAEVYSVGDTLQRVLLHHFSPWDLNFPFGPPPGAEEPPVYDEPLKDIPDDEEDECGGCTINPQSGTLREEIPIPGTPFKLNYDSSRQPGYRPDQKIEVPITDDPVHPELLRVEATVTVAGRKFNKTFSPAPNQSWTIQWDGKDIRGREVTGPASVSISVAHIYPMLYRVPDGWQSSTLWGAAPTKIEVNENNRFAYGETSLVRSSQIQVRGSRRAQLLASSALGGWTLHGHHSLEGSQGSRVTIERGDGLTLKAGNDVNIIRTVAGGGSEQAKPGAQATEVYMSPIDVAVAPDGALHIADNSTSRIWRVGKSGTLEVAAGNGNYEYSGDGGLAIEAGLKGPEGISFADDGSLLIADGGDNRIRRVNPDGMIETVAGNGNYGYGGDGGPALDAEFAWPWDVEQAPDGSLFIADPNNNRIRRVSTDGQIENYIGGDEWDFGGDGGPAADAQIDFPGSISYTSYGSLVFIDASYRIREIGKDGIVNTVAGSGTRGFGGDGGPATEALMWWPDSVVVSPQGVIYFSESGWNDNRIRRVGADGIINTIAGGADGYSGDGGPAREAQLERVFGLAWAPGGFLYVADYGNYRVREITPAIRLTDEGNLIVPSRNRQEIYYFNQKGQHLETRDALTGAVLWEFAYNEEKALIEIADGDGNVTRIERGATGVAQAIVAPDGQRTELVIDENDRLAAVEDPAGGRWKIEHEAGGLLSAFTDREGFRTEYFYNNSGEFLASVDALGGGWSVEGQNSGSTKQTQMTTAEGRVYSFEVEALPTDERKYIRTNPSGSETRRVVTPERARNFTELPDGTKIISREGPDPRFSMASPIPAYRSITLPSGLTLEATTSRDTELHDPNDPFSMSKQVDRVTANGRTSTLEFDADQLEWSMRSPAGRQSAVVVDRQGRPTHVTGGDLAPINYQYDERGRPISITALGVDAERTLAFEYHAEGHQAGYLAEITDSLSRTTHFEYDAVGRITRQTHPDGRSVDYSYDAEGRLKALTPPGRSAHLFEYTDAGNRERYKPPELPGVDAITIYRYNLDRQLTQIERPGGELVSFDYDAGGRLDSISSDAGVVDYSYQEDTGQLSTVTGPDNINLTLAWDGLLPVSETWSGEVNGAVTRSYDNNFWLIEEVVAEHAVAFDYDDDGLMTDAGDLSLTRDPGHGLISSTDLGGISGTRIYNEFGELANRDVEVDDQPVYQATYSRDAIGRIDQQNLEVNGLTDTWFYENDSAGRLEMVERNGMVKYGYVYDANGNRIEYTGPDGNTITADYDEQDRLLRYGDISYTHTDAGERLTKTDDTGTTHYDYDAAGNLREVILPDGTTIEYLIDGRNRRVGKKVDGELQNTWIYRDQLSPVAQFDGNANLTHRFVYAEKAHSPSWMVRIDPATGEETTYRIVSDHLGSVRLVIESETGAIAQQIDYGPFGQVLYDSNPGLQPFGFAGGLYDLDTELVRFGARDYEPEAGRWTAKDPIGFSGGDSDLYGYVFSDPVNLTDANGLYAGVWELDERPESSWGEYNEKCYKECMQDQFWNSLLISFSAQKATLPKLKVVAKVVAKRLNAIGNLETLRSFIWNSNICYYESLL
jgi:RHS repeat-associated protein